MVLDGTNISSVLDEAILRSFTQIFKIAVVFDILFVSILEVFTILNFSILCTSLLSIGTCSFLCMTLLRQFELDYVPFSLQSRPMMTQALEDGNHWLGTDFNDNDMARMIAYEATYVRPSARRRPLMIQYSFFEAGTEGATGAEWMMSLKRGQRIPSNRGG